MKERLRRQILDLGAQRAELVDAKSVITDRSFRDICKSNSCGAYGRCWACPPDCGDIDQLMDSLKDFDKAVVFQTVGQLEDSYDVEGMAEHKQSFTSLVLRVKELAAQHKGSLVLGAGGCGVCKTCSKREALPCRFPEKAIVSLEAYGVNVYELARLSGMKYINGPNTVTYFGAVFLKD